MDHVEKAVGDVELLDLQERSPASLGGVGAGFDPVGVGIGEVVHEHPMIPDPAVAISHDPRDHAGHIDHAHLAAALFGDFTPDGIDGRFAQLHHPAGETPLSRRGLATASNQEHAVAANDDGADADARIVRIFAAHIEPASQASVPYFSATSASTRAVSSTLSPSGRRVKPCSVSNALSKAAATSSNLGR